ncbi:hypothetical protein [Streptomyces roseolilacinus]|uniref:Uncharacterized protein n=1 Tax=Streptomyces roseolilacinus TaxID=66904 RepID=A0A918B5A8_9ACTN|nr:hypothetical protein [Streptomyces roseolilacinus]GGQ29472.1 hypothetical protein GCM10010249_55240 [Streptomyces roseolilacinus]
MTSDHSAGNRTGVAHHARVWSHRPGGGGDVEATAFRNAHATPPVTARDRGGSASFPDGPEVPEPGIVSRARRLPGPGRAGVAARFGAAARKP